MPRHPDLLSAGRSRLVVVDMQQRLLTAIDAADAVAARCVALTKAATQLGVPCFATEQNPGKLGPTIDELTAVIPDRREKLAFTAAGVLDLGVREAGLSASAGDRDQVVLCGIETGVCVLQTALDLSAWGWSVAVVADACGSRRPADAAVAIDRMRLSGVQIVTTDMVLFEWVERAGTDPFRGISRLVKDLPE